MYSPNLICFQEIFIPNYLAVFSEDYEVYVNVEINQKIGTALAIKKGIDKLGQRQSQTPFSSALGLVLT